MFWLLILLLISTVTGNNITLPSEGKFVSVKLSSDSSMQLFLDSFKTNSSNFFVPQCHSKQYNYTLTTTDGRETDSSIGDVVIAQWIPMSISNPRKNSTFLLHCTYTKYSLTGKYTYFVLYSSFSCSMNWLYCTCWQVTDLNC